MQIHGKTHSKTVLSLNAFYFYLIPEMICWSFLQVIIRKTGVHFCVSKWWILFEEMNRSKNRNAAEVFFLLQIIHLKTIQTQKCTSALYKVARTTVGSERPPLGSGRGLSLALWVLFYPRQNNTALNTVVILSFDARLDSPKRRWDLTGSKRQLLGSGVFLRKRPSSSLKEKQKSNSMNIVNHEKSLDPEAVAGWHLVVTGEHGHECSANLLS